MRKRNKKKEREKERVGKEARKRIESKEKSKKDHTVKLKQRRPIKHLGAILEK